MGTGAIGQRDADTILGSPAGSRSCSSSNMDAVGIVISSSCQRRFWKSITAISSAGITPYAIWWRFTVTVTTRYTGAVAINRIGSVLMTRAVPLEEPCAGQLACTVLQTSGGSDPFAEFNRSLRHPVQWRKTVMARPVSAGVVSWKVCSPYWPRVSSSKMPLCISPRVVVPISATRFLQRCFSNPAD